MKKILAIIVVLALVMTFMPLTAMANGASGVIEPTVSITRATDVAGATVGLNVSLEDFYGELQVISFRLSYDHTRLDFEGISWGTSLENSSRFQQKWYQHPTVLLGEIRIAVVTVVGEVIDCVDDLFTLEFTIHEDVIPGEIHLIGLFYQTPETGFVPVGGATQQFDLNSKLDGTIVVVEPCPYCEEHPCECVEEFELTISNWPDSLTPTNQTLTANHDVGNLIVLESGNAGANWIFLGWTTYENRPAIGSAWADADEWEDTEFYMPDGDLHLVAVWGNSSGLVGIPNPGGGGGFGGGGATPTPIVVLDDNGIPLAPFSQYHNAFLVGRPDGTIRPQANITRAEMATIVFRLLDDDFRNVVWTQQNPFGDVNINNWFNNAVSTMTNADVLRGTPDGAFRPNAAITRAEFAAVLARFFEENGYEQNNVFADTAGHWAEEYINRLASFGWVQGSGNGTFNPDELITRAEAAAMVNRMLDRVLASTDDLLEGRTRWPDKTNTNAWYYLYLQEATHSTEFERVDERLIWVEILSHLDWTILERPDSRSGDLVTSRGNIGLTAVDADDDYEDEYDDEYDDDEDEYDDDEDAEDDED